MRNFKLIKREIDIAPLLDEIHRHAHFWDLDTSRQDYQSVHGLTRTIILRSVKETATGDKRVRVSSLGGLIYTGRRQAMAEHFPQTSKTVEDFAGSIGGILGRVALVSLLPHGRVRSHRDFGLYCAIRSRYHLVLQSRAGSRLTSGDEQVTMREGELWWFNNRLVHQAFNGSDQDRIHIIFDVLTPASFGSAAYRLCRSRAGRVVRAVRHRIA